MSEEGLDIDVRELPGVGEATARKLKEAGIYTVRELLLYSPIYLSELLNISEERAEKLVITAHDFLRERGLISDDFVSAEELLERIKRRRYITTGSRNLDNLLKGAASQALQCFNITLGLPSAYSLLPEYLLNTTKGALSC